MTDRRNNEQLPAAIRHLRGLDTQAEFAAKVGCTRVAVSMWENGVQPSNRYAKRLVEMGLDKTFVLPPAPAATDAQAGSSSRGAA